MYCPQCRSEFREGVTHCASCDVDLVAEPPDEDAFASPENMAKLLADKELEALVVGDHINLQEFQRVLAEQRIASVIAGEPGEIEAAMHARFFLMVDVEDLESARQVFQQRWRAGVENEGLTLTTAEPLADDAAAEDAAGMCPACGAEVPDDAEECPDCGLFLGAGEDEEGEDEGENADDESAEAAARAQPAADAAGPDEVSEE